MCGPFRRLTTVHPRVKWTGALRLEGSAIRLAAHRPTSMARALHIKEC